MRGGGKEAGRAWVRLAPCQPPPHPLPHSMLCLAYRELVLVDGQTLALPPATALGGEADKAACWSVEGAAGEDDSLEQDLTLVRPPPAYRSPALPACAPACLPACHTHPLTPHTHPCCSTACSWRWWGCKTRCARRCPPPSSSVRARGSVVRFRGDGGGASASCGRLVVQIKRAPSHASHTPVTLPTSHPCPPHFAVINLPLLLLLQSRCSPGTMPLPPPPLRASAASCSPCRRRRGGRQARWGPRW